MITVIVDANVLLRLADAVSKHHGSAKAALSQLENAGARLFTVPQAIYEFWVVATRPVENNGLGLTIEECDEEIKLLEVVVPVLNDPRTLYADWRSLVKNFKCTGKVAHDARYAAAISALNFEFLLTFNGSDFARYPFISILDPNSIADNGLDGLPAP